MSTENIREVVKQKYSQARAASAERKLFLLWTGCVAGALKPSGK